MDVNQPIRSLYNNVNENTSLVFLLRPLSSIFYILPIPAIIGVSSAMKIRFGAVSHGLVHSGVPTIHQRAHKSPFTTVM